MADDSDLVALFPLPNVVLFPDVDLPLHVFEPRYRAMVGDAMNGDRRIGMSLDGWGRSGRRHGLRSRRLGADRNECR